MATANEGLKYLDERKDFWQQQKPVYARKAELLPDSKVRSRRQSEKPNGGIGNGNNIATATKVK